MTVVAAEAVPAVESTAASTAGTTAARTGGRTSQGRTPAPGQHMPGSFRPPKRSQPSQPARPAQPAQVTSIDDGQGRSVKMPADGLPEHTWHRWIMAEFILAVILVGASPFLRPGGLAGKVDKNLQPVSSLSGPVIRLTAVSLIYFILALMAQGPTSGKIAAAFGGLVLLGTAFNSLPEFTTLAKAFGGKPPAAAEGSTGPVTGDQAAEGGGVTP